MSEELDVGTDLVSEEEHTSWFSRLMESIKGVVVGLILFLASFAVLFLNEGRAVKTAKSLEEGRGAVVSVAIDKVNSANEGKLVHLSGKCETSETLTDSDFGISLNAIRLKRNVEMYQLEEHVKKKEKKQLGGGTKKVKTYSYKEVWTSYKIDSSQFKKEEYRNKNPLTWHFEPKVYNASKVTVGAFDLGDLVEKLNSFSKLAVDEKTLAKIPANITQKYSFKAYTGAYYLGDPNSPKVGDMRISFTAVKPTTVSVVAQQKKNTFAPYQTKVGRKIEMLKPGTHSADKMFAEALEDNATFTWICRLIGFLMMVVGLFLIFNPFVVFADVLPILGDILGLGVGLFAGVLALALSSFTIAIAWLFYRPLVGIVLIVVGLSVFFAFASKGKNQKKPDQI